MVYVAAPLALLLLLVALIYADVHRHALMLRLRGLYGLESLQFRSGLRTLQEVELAVDSTLRPDGLFELPRSAVAALPYNWRTRGVAFLVPAVFAVGALSWFLVSCFSEPHYSLLAIGGGYTAFCFAWDMWVVCWFDFQVGSHRQLIQERRHEELVASVDAELEEDDYSIPAVVQLSELLVEDELRQSDSELAEALANRANAPALKLAYRAVSWVLRCLIRRQQNEVDGLRSEYQGLLDDLERERELSQELLCRYAEILDEPPPYLDPILRQPPPPLDLVLAIKIDELCEQRLLGQAAGDIEVRLARLELIRSRLPA